MVLKILSAQITHKSDVGGVAVGLTAETVGARLTQMAAEVEAKAGVRPQRYLVQEMVGGGTELILGMHRDPLGTAILLGMGGVTAELFKDTTMRLLPADQGLSGLSRAEALSMAQELKTWPLLDGFRGRPKADVDALVDRHRRLLAHGGATGRAPGRGRDQPGLRAAARAGRARRRRRGGAGLRASAVCKESAEMHATQIFARFAQQLAERPLPDKVVHHAQRAVIDWYASLYPGLDMPAVQVLEATLADDLDRGDARLALRPRGHGARGGVDQRHGGPCRRGGRQLPRRDVSPGRRDHCRRAGGGAGHAAQAAPTSCVPWWWATKCRRASAW